MKVSPPTCSAILCLADEYLHLAGSKKFAGKERIKYSFYEELYFAPGQLKFCDKDNVLDFLFFKLPKLLLLTMGISLESA